MLFSKKSKPRVSGAAMPIFEIRVSPTIVRAALRRALNREGEEEREERERERDDDIIHIE